MGDKKIICKTNFRKLVSLRELDESFQSIIAASIEKSNISEADVVSLDLNSTMRLGFDIPIYIEAMLPAYFETYRWIITGRSQAQGRGLHVRVWCNAPFFRDALFGCGWG
jgi:hypothetical protein